MKRSSLVIVAFLGLSVGFSFLLMSEGYSARASALEPSPTPSRLYMESKSMPEEVKYLVLFAELRDLKYKDSQNQLAGESTAFASSYYESRLGLTSTQSASVDGIIGDAFSQIQPLDQQAHDIIAQYRSANPNGELKKLQAPDANNPYSNLERLPAPPVQLTNLQNQKNQIILAARNLINQSLGDAEFAEFNAAVTNNATRMLAPINSRPAQPRVVPTPNQ